MIIVLIIIPILWNKLLLNLTQVCNVNAQQQKKLKKNHKIPRNKQLIWVRHDIHKDPENKLPFHKFSTKLHM
jgi:hypothetical protein